MTEAKHNRLSKDEVLALRGLPPTSGSEQSNPPSSNLLLIKG